MTKDEIGMIRAIEAAEYGVSMGERPFGSVIMDPDNRFVIGQSFGSESRIDPVHHSEILAIQQACFSRGRLLHGCTLYQTHEPCPMCCGAICHSKLSRVVVGSLRSDLQPLFRQRRVPFEVILSDTSQPPDIVYIGGTLANRCVHLFDDEIKTCTKEDRTRHLRGVPDEAA